MALVFVIALIGFIGLAVVYISLRLPDSSPRRRFGRPTVDKSTSKPTSQLLSSHPKARSMEIVGQPQTDLSIYYSNKSEKSDKKNRASRRQVEQMMRGELGISTEPSPVETSSVEESLSDTDITTEELARWKDLPSSECSELFKQKLRGADLTAVYKDKSQALQEALDKMVGISSGSTEMATSPASNYL